MTIVYENDLPAGIDFGDSVAIDCEMMGLNVFRDRLCLMQLADKDGNCYIVKFDGNDYSAPNIKKMLEDEKIQKIGQFIRYDLTSIKHYIGVMPKNIYCTKIASRLCRTYTQKHGLKDLVLEVSGTELEKENQCSDWSSNNLTDDQLRYAANDVVYLHEIREHLNNKLTKVGREKIAQKCFDFLPIRVELDLMGFAEENIFNHH